MQRKFLVFVLLTLIGSVFLAACATGEEPTATPRPTNTATTVPTEEATAEASVATEEATMEMTVEAEMTMEATMEATMEMTEEAAARTAEPAVAATEEATMEMTEEATMEAVMTEEATMEATPDMAMTPEAATTEEATPDMVMTPEAAATEETVNLAGTIESVCLITDVGSIDDGTFNQLAYNGMVRAAEDFNLEDKYIETQNQADYTNNIQTCIDEGYDAIITVGFLITDATLEAAQNNPSVYFIGVDQGYADAPDNLVGIQFREDQAGFLAGVMAGLLTESNVVGGVYGVDIPAVIKFRNGFEQGVRFVNPEARILGVYIGSFVASAEGADAADNFIGEGADVIFGAGGQTGSGAILRAAERGVKVIGVDQDEFFTTFGRGATPGAENLVTSAIKRVDEGIYQMLNALSVGEYGWPVDGDYIMDAVVDGVGFAPANAATVPEDVTARVQEVFEALKTGELTTGVDPISGELLEPMEAPEEAATEEMEMTPEATMEATPEATARP